MSKAMPLHRQNCAERNEFISSNLCIPILESLLSSGKSIWVRRLGLRNPDPGQDTGGWALGCIQVGSAPDIGADIGSGTAHRDKTNRSAYGTRLTCFYLCPTRVRPAGRQFGGVEAKSAVKNGGLLNTRRSTNRCTSPSSLSLANPTTCRPQGRK